MGAASAVQLALPVRLVDPGEIRRALCMPGPHQRRRLRCQASCQHVLLTALVLHNPAACSQFYPLVHSGAVILRVRPPLPVT